MYADSAAEPTASTSNDSNAVSITCSRSDFNELRYCTTNFSTTCDTRARVQCCKLVAVAIHHWVGGWTGRCALISRLH